MNYTWNQDRSAINHIERAVLDLDWIWREQPIVDFGIDGQIEICHSGEPTGKILAVQSKGGVSHYRELADGSISISLKVKHLRYWQVYVLPVLVVVYCADKGASYWLYVQDWCDRHEQEISDERETVTVHIVSSQRFDLTSKQLLETIPRKHLDRLLTELLAKGNPLEPIYEQLAELAKSSGLDPEAFRDFIDAVSKDPDADSLLGQAITLLAKKQISQASALLTGIINSSEARLSNQYAWLAGAHVESREFEEAERSASRALELVPTNAVAMNVKGIVLAESGDIPKALEVLESAAGADLEFAAPSVNMGRIYLDRKDYSEAIPYLNDAINRFPGKVDAHRYLGDCLKHLNRLDEAESSYKRAIEIREDADAWKGLGDIYAARNDASGAIEAYTRCVSLAPDYAIAFSNRGAMYVRLRQLENAKADFERALELDPTYVKAGRHLQELKKIL